MRGSEGCAAGGRGPAHVDGKGMRRGAQLSPDCCWEALCGVRAPIAVTDVLAVELADPAGAQAVLERGADGLVVRDMGSLNGTYVNRRRIEAAEPLQDGDELQIGKFRLLFIAG